MVAHNVLIVEDCDVVGRLLREILSREGFIVSAAGDGATAEDILRKKAIDVVILDLGLPDASGMTLLVKWRQDYPRAQFIILTGNQKISTAVECIKAGAFDFLLKPVETDVVLKTIGNALRYSKMAQRVEVLTELSRRESTPLNLDPFSAESPAMRETLALAQRVAASDSSCILITGESGTGKGYLARAIYKMSGRSGKPFVEVNCSAMPATLIESELFGHQKGAFTDAKENRIGVFEMADGGTLFLDEIGDMELSLQAKLLKVVEEQKFRRLGSAMETHVDVRIIAATNQDLLGLVADGKFRRDLYYRVNVVPLEIPPLRNRTLDIPRIAQDFMGVYSQKCGKRNLRFSDEALAALTNYSWPGNVRELRNLVERVCLLAERDRIESRDLMLPQAKSERGTGQTVVLDRLPAMPLVVAEKQVIQAAMEKAKGNRDMAAEILGIHRTTLYRKLGALGRE